MNARTIIDLETCQSNPKFETVALVAKELNISVDAAIFPDMVNQTVSKTVVDFFAGKSEAEIEKYIALCKQAEAFSKKTNNAAGFDVPGRVTVLPVCYAGGSFLLVYRHRADARGLLADDMLHPEGRPFPSLPGLRRPRSAGR